jgi:23S rRNA pseudouridine2604 synthase
MRINQFVAQATGLSRRSVDKAIAEGRVKVNTELASLGQDVKPTDKVSLNNIVVMSVHEMVKVLLPYMIYCLRNTIS